MKTEFRKNEGDVVRSLLDGMFYRVLNISEESVTAKPVEEEDIDGKRVFIETPADTIDVNRNVFDELFFVVEKAPATVPGDGTFSISNGMFLKNGNRIETGTLVPVEIMALIPGAVLLTVRSRTEGKLDLFHYDVETDEFHKLTNAKDRIEFVYGYGSPTATTWKRQNWSSRASAFTATALGCSPQTEVLAPNIIPLSGGGSPSTMRTTGREGPPTLSSLLPATPAGKSGQLKAGISGCAILIMTENVPR